MNKNAKNITQKIILILLSLTLWHSSVSYAHGICGSGNNNGSYFGGIWPWGNEMPFPWKGIQGVWYTERNGCRLYYNFKVAKHGGAEGEKILQATQYDPLNCRIIARGVGYETGRVVNAVMATGSDAFQINVRAFNPSIIGAAASVDDDGVIDNFVTVLNSSSIGSPESYSSFQLHKLADNSTCKF